MPAANLGGVRFSLDDRAYDDTFFSVTGPVGQLVAELSTEATAIARRAVHVWPGTPRSTIWNIRTSTAILPSGYTRERTVPHGPVRSPGGWLYGGVNAPLLPSVFLEHPSEQMYEKYPFLTTSIEELRL